MQQQNRDDDQSEKVTVKMFRATKRTPRFNKNQKVWVCRRSDNFLSICYKYRGSGRYVHGKIDQFSPIIGTLATVEVDVEFADRHGLQPAVEPVHTIESAYGEKLSVVCNTQENWEYRCHGCDQLRLFVSDEKPTMCANCASENITVGRPGTLPGQTYRGD